MYIQWYSYYKFNDQLYIFIYWLHDMTAAMLVSTYLKDHQLLQTVVRPIKHEVVTDTS